MTKENVLFKLQACSPEPSFAALISQILAVATHYLDDVQLDNIKAAGTEILVIGAGQDQLVRLSLVGYFFFLKSRQLAIKIQLRILRSSIFSPMQTCVPPVPSPPVLRPQLCVL